MAIKNILVAYNGTKSSDTALKTALCLRKKYDAHLTGLLAYGVPSANPAISASFMPKNIEALLEEAQNKAAKKIREKFIKLTKDEDGQDKIHWIASIEQSDATVAKYARMYDLTVVGRYEAISDEARTILHPDTIAMVSGRPVLIVPREVEMSCLCDHVVLAWDGKRASARALGDATQMLDPDSHVAIVTVDEDSADTHLPGIDIETALKRHDINTEMVKLKKRRHSISKTILAYLKESQASFLVMGAYEHSKFRQTVVGGVTDKVLKKVKMPILISH